MEDVETDDSAAPKSKANMSRLLDCSHELLHNILTSIDSADLAALAVSCKSLHAFISGNKLLHKELYLRRWDCPAGVAEPNWEIELHKNVKLEKMFASDDFEYKRDSLPLAACVIPSLVAAPNPALNTSFLASAFKSQMNVDALLARSSIYRHAGTSTQEVAETPELRQAAAHLHCLYGIPVDSRPIRSTSDARPGAHAQTPYHILYPRYHHEHFTRAASQSCIPANNIARAKVYDLNEYTPRSLWGPFKGDGSLEVDWEKMEAIMVLLAYNLRLFSERISGINPLWYKAWEGVAPNSFHSPSPGTIQDEAGSIAGMFTSLQQPAAPSYSTRRSSDPTDEELDKERRQAELNAADPYGVSGTWMRVVCFLDYNDLYAFNFTRNRNDEEQQRVGIDTREAIRLIKLKTKVTKIVYPSRDREEDSDSSPDYNSDPAEVDTPLKHDPAAYKRETAKAERLNDYKEWPVVHFVGTSRSLHASWDPNANSRIRGQVRMTKHGDVRWTTFSIFHGEERWRSEGVQIGGPKSGRGVLGNWFDKDYERHGPAGPTAFWKISDHIIDDKDEDAATVNPIPYLWQYDNPTDTESEGDEDFDEERNPVIPGSSEEREDFGGEEDAVPGAEDEGREEHGGVNDVEIIDEEVDGVEFVLEEIERTEEVVE